jgi:hypothetical protein
LRLAIAPALLLALAAPAPAKVILGEPEVDRASDQFDGLWCPAEQIQMYNGTFTADGPEVTLEFNATNHHLGNWRHERIDNVIVVPLADRNATYHLPDSALAAAYSCLEQNKNYFHFSDVPPANIKFLDQFHLGPNPGWDMTNGAYTNPLSSALNAFELPVDNSGGSLGLGLDQDPSEEVTTEITINGFTAGQQYFVSTWTQCADPTIGNDLLIRIYGTEFFSIAGQQPVDVWPSRGCAWGDYDNDGDLDLYVVNLDSACKLWRNNGAGVFQDVTNASGAALTTLAVCVAWGDGDNDGDLDLYIGTYAQNRYFKNNGNGTFTNATIGPLGDTRQTESCDWGDYDRDGDLDLFLGNVGNDALLRNNGGGSFTDIAAGTLLGSGRPVGVQWVDYDKDNDPDLFVTYNAQANELFVNSNGAFVKATPPLLAVALNNASAAWGDYDNDSDLDLYMTTLGSGNHLYKNNGGGNFVDVTPGPLADAGQGIESIWGDWDNDRDLDLYLIKNNQPNRLFRNVGAGNFVDHPTGTVETAGPAYGTAWGDYDGEGDIDLYVAKSGVDVLYRNEFGDNQHWLQVDLKGTISNRFGVGAKVYVTAGGVTQLREVGGESGLRSFGSLTAEFGLGPGTTASSVRVDWPSGIHQTLANVPGDQKILIVEGAVDAVTIAQAPTLELTGYPNPFRSFTTISYAIPHDGPVDVRIYDIAGRVVTTLVNGSKPAGSHSVEWLGVDRDGQEVAAGIYFCELVAGGERVTKKIVRRSSD